VSGAGGATRVPLVVLDDDPTGAQTLSGVCVLLEWDATRIAAALERYPAVHLLTNSRALAPDEACVLVRKAARAAAAATPAAQVVLRGDSTLRAHLREEYEGVRDALFPGEQPVLLLVPALPAAGRITLGGIHLLRDGGAVVPLADTEYARDGPFAYSSSRLLDWADERSGGLFPADDGVELHLAELRGPDGVDRLTGLLVDLAGGGRPAACVPDAESNGDLALVADAYRRASKLDARVVVRCSPALVGVLSGAEARSFAHAPRASRLLIVCGSFVATTTRQLAALRKARPEALFIEVDPVALTSSAPEHEIARAGDSAGQALAATGIAVLTTPRRRPAQTLSFEPGERVAIGLARAAGAVRPEPDVVVAKGGITSAVTVRVGLEATSAEVVGPLLPGVSLWRLADGRAVIVVPGNVGADDLLVRLVAMLREDEPG